MQCEIILLYFSEQGKTITRAYNTDLLTRLSLEFVKKRHGKPQHNAPAHKLLISLQNIYEIGFELVDHTTYTSDLTLFTKFKKHLKDNSFLPNEEAKCTVAEWFYIKNKTFLNGLYKS